jgi:Fe-S-cluster-containing dehydrogenase component/formate-dependent nitrite reductase membrane component NrfD
VTRWAWVIDQTRCIGCHACTTACKAENHVALGVFRTWVKNVDVGTFPSVRRHFAVLRCNHCEDAPCVEICPVTAMYQRPDGLVDFDEDLCIGCKACMQACPYDAIYMDPDTNTAAKCNFCSHRVDEGLLPACVIVCPVEALIFGDMDDPTSRVSRELASKKVTVRRPEQMTRPKAFYIGAHEAALDPLAASHEGMYMWADGTESRTHGRTATPGRGNGRGRAYPAHEGGSGRSRSDGAGAPMAVPARVAYDIPRQRAWAWKVSSYIWTKGIGAGVGLVAALEHLYGDASGDLLRFAAPAIALLFLALTTALLVVDLKRPERFWTIIVRPQWRSWLARGAFLLLALSAVQAVWAGASWLGMRGVMDLLAWPLALLALLGAVYTAFLFRQCEGRDLWQSRLMLPHLLLHAPLAGAAALFLTAPALGATGEVLGLAAPTAAGLALLAALALLDALGRHPTANGAAAARALARGRFAPLFWTALLGGTVLPAILMLLAVTTPALLAPAGAISLCGLWLYGHALVLAGQGPPIS